MAGKSSYELRSDPMRTATDCEWHDPVKGLTYQQLTVVSQTAPVSLF